jgi:hypothetical protein
MGDCGGRDLKVCDRLPRLLTSGIQFSSQNEISPTN